MRYVVTRALTRYTILLNLAALVFVLLVGGASPVLSMKAAPGHYEIASEVVFVKDQRRHKEYPIHITYPIADGKFPIIIFSHGNSLSGNSYKYLIDYWAEHGYVCVQPFHEDSLDWSRYQKSTLKCMDLIRSLPENKRAWIDRARDVSFTIDTLPTAIPKLAGKLDMTRVGVGGHSYGAYTSLMLAGARVPRSDLPPKCDSVKDKRVKAIISISSQGVQPNAESIAFDNKSELGTVTVPALFVTGDRDEIAGTKLNERDVAYKYSPPGDKYYISLRGANHMTFTGPPDKCPIKNSVVRMIMEQVNARMLEPYGDEEAQRKLVQQASLMFWDAYLKDDKKTKAEMTHGRLASLIAKSGETRAK